MLSGGERVAHPPCVFRHVRPLTMGIDQPEHRAKPSEEPKPLPERLVHAARVVSEDLAHETPTVRGRERSDVAHGIAQGNVAPIEDADEGPRCWIDEQMLG